MKTKYELYLQTWSHLNPNAQRDKDYETIEFVPCINYRDAVKQAKQVSLNIPYLNRHGDEIVRVKIAAYYGGEEAEEKYDTGYYRIWLETYEKGKCIGRHYD